MISLLLLPLLSVTSPVLSDPLSNYYTAAVYEHVRLGNVSADSPEQIIHMNLDMYNRATQVAESKGADIIVFPEYGIFPPNSREGLKKYLETAPDPSEGEHNPCVQADEYADRPILLTLSCMARQHNIVVVANTGDIQPCSETDSSCPEDGVFHFNTNVAFDRDGKLIGRYHKVHLFYELGMNVAQQPQNPTFSTDFGTFAMFICFDIVFKISADAAQNSSVDNVLLPTMWIDPVPLMSAAPFWQAWALGNKVTFLASNIQIPGYGAVGSGVFSGHMGALKYTSNPDGLSKLVVSRVPKSKHQVAPFPNPDSSITVITSNGTESYPEDKDGKDVPELCSSKVLGEPEDVYHDYRCMQENTVNYTFVKLTKKEDFLQTCNNGMCCSLNYSALSMDDDFYFGVYNGTYSFFRYFYCQENCLVVRCDPFDDNPCQTFHLRSNTVFTQLDLRANFTTKFVYPTVAKSGMRLGPITEWSHGITGEDYYEGHLNFASSSSDPLVVAGLNGRCYDRDPPYKR